MPKSLQQMMKDDADAVALPTKEELGDLEVLANKQLKIEQKIVEVEAYLKTLGENLQSIQVVTIPAMFDQLGIIDFTLKNGKNIEIKESIRASIRADFKREAVLWLDDNSLGGIVKHDFRIKLARGEGEHTTTLVKMCDELDLDYDDAESVHAGTLKATIKEQRTKGVQFPEEYFSIFDDRKAVIKLK
jgi:hypothetical protein